MQRNLKTKKNGVEGKSGIGDIGIEEKRTVSIACYHFSKTIVSFQ
jgi:hypothetical protein